MLIIFQRPFLRGLCTEGNLRFKIDWASLILGGKFTGFFCFTLYLRAISNYTPPPPPRGGGYIWRGDFTEVCSHYEFGGLLEGLIHGGAFTISPSPANMARPSSSSEGRGFPNRLNKLPEDPALELR